MNANFLLTNALLYNDGYIFELHIINIITELKNSYRSRYLYFSRMFSRMGLQNIVWIAILNCDFYM